MASSPRAPRILLLSAYDAGSHRAWRRTLVAGLPGIDWTVSSLSPRHFAWRLRGNALVWWMRHRALLEADYDALIVTSMVDLATLRGLFPRLAGIPALVYMHENQFAYPSSSEQTTSVEARMVNLYTVLSADLVVFNSRYNCDSFFAGARQLLRALPDGLPETSLCACEAAAQVLPVPLPVTYRPRMSAPTHAVTLVWNHRWEYDKAPERLLAGLMVLRARGFDFRLCLAGETFRKVPAARAQIVEAFAEQLVHEGFAANRQDYLNQLDAADLVVSTAMHEFQGLAVLEAVAHGCVPIVPDRLVYPELFGSQLCYPSSPDDPATEAQAFADAIMLRARELPCHAAVLRQAVEAVTWSGLQGAYARVIDELLARRRS